MFKFKHIIFIIPLASMLACGSNDETICRLLPLSDVTLIIQINELNRQSFSIQAVGDTGETLHHMS